VRDTSKRSGHLFGFALQDIPGARPRGDRWSWRNRFKSPSLTAAYFGDDAQESSGKAESGLE
jgi:hypothetical protein